MTLNAKDTKSTYAHAAIVRIKLENFVTYDSLEFTPGPNLNVVIGPNGTGKSTIVCAICLGMAGKPNVLGRAANLADFIKYGKNRATIEIELNNKHIGANYNIKRDIFKDNKSDWYINNKKMMLKDVEELVMELNIQVGNLCQFLPQEKVTEFARLNPQQLLENTEKAVGGTELYEKHINLKERREESKTLEKELENLKDSLKKEAAINSRQESQVKNYMEKQKNEQNILWLKRKRAWIVYEEKKSEYDQLKKTRDDAQKRLTNLEASYAPLVNKKKEIEKCLNKENEMLAIKSEQTSTSMNKMKSIDARSNEYIDKIAEAKVEYQNRETECKQMKTRINELKASIEAMKIEYDESKDILADLVRQEAENREKEMGLRNEIEKAINKEQELMQKISKTKGDREEIQRKIINLQNVRNEKAKKLRENYYNDTNIAMEWLEQNRDKFEGRFYEPMLFTINIKKPEAAKYVESVIARRDLNALFLFENSNDMHMFVTEMRDKRGDKKALVVHAARVPENPVNTHVPPYSIDELKDYGFSSYIREVIDAPDAVMRYLCLYSHIHCVPYGDERTQRNIKDIIPRISKLQRVYTSTHQYTFNKSRYTNSVTSSSSEVADAFFLSSSVDNTLLNSSIEREKQLRQQIADMDVALKAIQDERRQLDKQSDELKAQANKIREKKHHIVNLERKIGAKKTMLDRLQSQNIDLVIEARNKYEKIVDICRKRVALYVECQVLAKRIMTAQRDKVMNSYHLNKYHNEIRSIDATIRTSSAQRMELQRELEHQQNLLKDLKDGVTEVLDIAYKICGIPADKDLPREHKRQFDSLPGDIDGIDSKINQMEAMAQCTYDIDKHVVDEFFKRQKVIEELQRRIDDKSNKLDNHRNNYETIRNEWNTEVEEMIKRINVKFSELFRMLRCLGEIGLNRPDNPEDFDKYGVGIRVSFRTEEKLQELTSWQQSGGEKSVSTMLYMIALQEMTKCPFRVVDEINQGMDPINERKVFDIIVKNSSSQAASQYFLLTPKLLPDLAFDNKTRIICVFNGLLNLPHSQYNYRRFIETRKKLNDQEQIDD